MGDYSVSQNVFGWLHACFERQTPADKARPLLDQRVQESMEDARPPGKKRYTQCTRCCMQHHDQIIANVLQQVGAH